MAKKRLTFMIDEELHNRLKAEAAEKGVSLGSHCTRLLMDEKGNSLSHPSVEELDTTTISAMPLNALRELCTTLVENKPTNWQQAITRVNSEIRRRYRV